MPWENHSNNLKTHFEDWNEASMIAETHKKAKFVLFKDSFPWQNHSDNLNIQFKDLNDAFNERRNSQKVKIHQFSGIVP